MPLARDFLRLCALEALAPSGTADAGPWPTLAGTYVFDTRLDPNDDLDPTEQRPVISVYTEDEHLTKISQHGPVFYKSTADLVFEIAVLAKFAASDSDNLIVDYADTDAALEALIGSIESQIFLALHGSPSGALFRRIAKMPFDGVESTTKRSSEESLRLAKRTVIAKVPLKEFCYEGVPDAPRAGLLRLPPGLQDIATALSNSTYRTALVLGIAQASPQMPVRTDLAGVSMTVTEGSGGADTVTASAEFKPAPGV
jgi:hypothetical protein